MYHRIRQQQQHWAQNGSSSAPATGLCCLFIYVTVGQLFQLYEDVLEQKISKDLPVLPPQINQTPFFSVNVTGGTDLCRWPPSCKQRSTGSAPPRGRPDQDPSQSWRSRSAGKATWLRVYNPRPVQISGRRCDDAAEGFILQTALASMSAAFPPPRRNWLLFSFRGETGWQGRRRGLAASRPRRPKRPDGGRDEVRETSSSQRNHRSRFCRRLLPPRCSSVSFALNMLTKCLLTWTKPESLSGVSVGEKEKNSWNKSYLQDL